MFFMNYPAFATPLSCVIFPPQVNGLREEDMDKRITFRFYKVVRERRARMAFGNALTEIGNIPRRSGREAHLGTDYYARAEIIAPERGAIVGEMTRIQKTNFPSEIDGDNRIPLQTRNPLGHGVVFRYLPGSGDLGIQYEPRVLSPGRFVQYVGEMLDDAFFELRPIIRNDMWDQFRQSIVRKISIAVASPQLITRVDRGGAAAAISSIKDMAEAYEAPKITIEMSMGNRPGALSESVKQIVRHFRRRAVQEHRDVADADVADVTRMKARIKPGEGEPTEEIDLLDDILAVREELELRDNDPDANYQIKLEALRTAMREWIVA
jgi:hypothetical protein